MPRTHLKISIITAVLNCKDFIESTILSVLNQNYPNLEYIIIDGGSTDGTIDIIKKHQERISYWISEPDNGLYYAIQKGFNLATGDIIGWLNSDDMLHPTSLTTISDIFSTIETVNWITGIPSLINSDGQCAKVFQMQRWSKTRVLAGDYRWIQQESTFWRKSLWESCGGSFDEKYQYAADFDLWIRFFDKTQLVTVETILAGFRIHERQISFIEKRKYEKEAQLIMNSYNDKNKLTMTVKVSSLLYKLKTFLQNNNDFFSHSLATSISFILRKLYAFPNVIHFDFSENKWIDD